MLSRRQVLRGAVAVAGLAAVEACTGRNQAPDRSATPTRWVRVETSGLTPGSPVWVDLAPGPVSTSAAPSTPPPSYAADRPAAWLVLEADGTVVAFDPRCTHQQCLVDWVPGSSRFACRCHPGAFSADGAVLAPPPRRPLDRRPMRPAGPGAVEIGLAGHESPPGG